MVRACGMASQSATPLGSTCKCTQPPKRILSNDYATHLVWRWSMKRTPPHPVLVPRRSKPWAIRTLEHPYPMNPIPDLARNLRGHEPNSGTSSSLYPSRPQPGHGSHYPSSWLSTLVSDALDFNYITLLLQPFLNVPGPLLTSGSHH